MKDADPERPGETIMRRMGGSLGIIVAVTILFSYTGCSRVLYSTLQQGQVMNCQKMQGATGRDECLRRSDMSYDEYRHQLTKQDQEK